MSEGVQNLDGFTLNEIMSNGMNFMYLRLARLINGQLMEKFLCLAYPRVEECELVCDPLFSPGLKCFLSQPSDGSRSQIEIRDRLNLLRISFTSWVILENELGPVR